ncbi:hypothetical protein CBR_g9172 [Chara braunii]|uniref:DUF4360 domain-containing protein n=1 Tax=Chara braunii TaxID=69332 RepID=A0A388KNZ1_CHABU|nr:hypothetical protein CBR_g9172 [Chara braunii]|eukprot:GBG71764.1 hypothetical protein CBR_g9172 [Chara braunii]
MVRVWRVVEFVTAALPTRKPLLLVMFILLSAAMGQGQEAPAPAAPETARIKSFTYAGSGCPPGSAVGSISEDGEVLTLKFSNFSVSTSSTPLRKNCDVAINLQYPAGWSYSLASVVLRGYANLDAGVKGVHKVSNYVQGQQSTGYFTGYLEGPYNDNYQHNGDLEPVVFSECHKVRDININTEVRVDNSANPTGSGILDVDTKDVLFKFEIQWKLCSEGLR